MENLNPDFLDFITLLDQRSVEYLIVGGYAVGFHGFPRYTGDIDFFVSINEENAEKLRFIGLDALVRNKKASGRPKDLIDVQELTGLQERWADRSL